MDFRFKRPNLDWRCEMVDGELQFQILYQNMELFIPHWFEREVHVKALNGVVFHVIVASYSYPEIYARSATGAQGGTVDIFLQGVNSAHDNRICTQSNRVIRCTGMLQSDLMFVVNSALRLICERVDKELSDGLLS